MMCRKCGHRKAKGKDCKFCHRERAKKAVRHPEGCLRHRFRDLIKRTRSRHWPPPNFDQAQFVAHFAQDPEFLRIWKTWEAKKYHKDYAPSVDRNGPELPRKFPRNSFRLRMRKSRTIGSSGSVGVIAPGVFWSLCVIQQKGLK